MTLAPSLQEAQLDGVELIVADLDAENPEALVGLGVPVLGFYSHVNVETREAAEAAGVDLVVPRSRLAREMPELAEAPARGLSRARPRQTPFGLSVRRGAARLSPGRRPCRL